LLVKESGHYRGRKRNLEVETIRETEKKIPKIKGISKECEIATPPANGRLVVLENRSR